MFLSCLLTRLSAGRDQAHHLTWRAQERCPGRGQHSYSVERCAGGIGVLTQERPDPQVGPLRHWCHDKRDTAAFWHLFLCV